MLKRINKEKRGGGKREKDGSAWKEKKKENH